MNENFNLALIVIISFFLIVKLVANAKNLSLFFVNFYVDFHFLRSIEHTLNICKCHRLVLEDECVLATLLGSSKICRSCHANQLQLDSNNSLKCKNNFPLIDGTKCSLFSEQIITKPFSVKYTVYIWPHLADRNLSEMLSNVM